MQVIRFELSSKLSTLCTQRLDNYMLFTYIAIISERNTAVALELGVGCGASEV